MTEPYRPSNGTEGDSFMTAFCYQCKHCEKPCEIMGRALGYSLGDPEYPKEWVQDKNGARCTAFALEGTPDEPVRCDKTVDMFGGMQ